MLQMTGIAVLVFSCVFMLPAFLKNKRFVIVVCCMYAIGFLHFTLLSRKPSQDAVIRLQLFKYLRETVSFDYGFFYVAKKALKQLFDGRLKSGLLYALRSVRIEWTESLTGVILNMLLFIPFGYLLPCIIPKLRKHLWCVVELGFLLSLIIESLQLIWHLGWFDVDDLLNNTIGTIVGILIYKLFLLLNNR